MYINEQWRVIQSSNLYYNKRLQRLEASISVQGLSRARLGPD